MKWTWKRNRILAVLLAISMLFSTISISASASGFSDISSTYSYLDSANYVSDNQIMVGTGSNQFNPKMSLTRAMAVMALYNKAGSPFTTITNKFTDVPSTAWYATAVSWAVNNGIAGGTSSTTFSPNSNVTRQDAMCFLYHYSQKTVTAANRDGSITGYSDYSSVADYARDAMRWAIKNGVLETISGQLAPKAVMTRIQLAHAITRFGTNVERLANARDRLSFYNEGHQEDTQSTSIYFSKKYYMHNSHRIKWKKRLQSIYTDTSTYNNIVASFTRFLGNEDVVGRCFGMSSVSVLDKYGKIAFNENFSSASSMQLASCSPASWAESAITYFHASQVIPFLDIDMARENDIGPLLNAMRNADGPSIFNYVAFTPEDNFYAHSVVVNSCAYSGGNYILNLYDSNIAGTCTWKISPSNGIYYLPNGDHFSYGYTITDIDTLDFLDIDGYQNSKGNATSTSSQPDLPEASADTEAVTDVGTIARWGVGSDEIATILLPLEKDVAITNDRGETLTLKDGKFSGDMEVYYWNFITGISPLTAYVIVPVSETYKIETAENQESAAFRVADKYRYQFIDGLSGTAALHSDGTMELTGNLQNLKVECLRSQDNSVQSLTGVGSDTVKIGFAEDRLSASGMVGNYVVGWVDETGTEQAAEITPAFSVEESD